MRFSVYVTQERRNGYFVEVEAEDYFHAASEAWAKIGRPSRPTVRFVEKRTFNVNGTEMLVWEI